MQNDNLTARRRNGADKSVEELVVLACRPRFNSDSTLYGHRYRDSRTHCRTGRSVAFRFRHQAGTEATALHPIAGAAAVQIDFVVAKLRADRRRFREQPRVVAA